MPERPEPLVRLDGYFAAARIAHEYAYDLHRELVERDAANDHTRELLNESAAVTLERMPALTGDLHDLERQWSEQKLLDPPAARRTAERLASRLAAVEPSSPSSEPDRIRSSPNSSTCSTEQDSADVQADSRAVAACS